ncbi:hypothetical protein G4434_16235 [Coprococcus comes]|uniref:DUF5688 family protein n=1 Tax=Coprococcus comes TaxID=410072 RepID=UPI00156E1153|nr:DUF5688 family protein [Coprococcus comes]NSF20039.1 hypothetical protein [Coprococcus comes]
MNYTEFMNAMLCEIRGQVDAQVRTELYTVTKNNGTRRTGILFKQEDSNLAPTIYLEEFYQKYLKGQQVPDLADSICSIYQEIRVKKTCDCQNLFDFNHVKEHIVYKLIRRDANEELLKQIPYEPFLDLAVVYYIQIDNTRFGSAAIQIRNEHLRYWRVEKEEIRRFAEKNTPRIYPVQIRQIVRFMYVATNEQCSLGAAVMRYPDFREKVRGMIRGDFYILPSSIHEVILVPESFGLEPERMQEMVKEINQTGVAPEEVLSDSVYYFDGEEIRIVVK